MNAPPDGLPLLRRLTWWTLLGCLVVVAFLIAAEAVRLPWRAAVMTFAATAVAITVAAVLFARPLRDPILVAGALAGAVVVAVARVNDTGAFPWVLPLACVTAAAWARWTPPVVPAAGSGVAFLAALAGSRGAVTQALVDAAITALGAGGLYAQIWVLHVAERLERARTLERAAAVSEERLRFAADLHDIQGASLHVIALKSEFAQHLVTGDPARAVAELREVQELALRALTETTDVVNGYRNVSLDREIVNAARVLRSAGIAVTIPELPDIKEPAKALFGLVVRECTTNVLRHSAATRCEIKVFVNDGLAELRLTNDRPLDPAPAPAGGLAGLAGRLTAAGGALDYAGTPENFTVRATVPVTA
ncbi:sensor histidine kinase [Nucisporomicrobium flavum]|uniref:sensor histidine kinase n=1 Tax=Nucisporomicrobium flavum TaxID=2785915 RepID=UPI003C2AF323